METKDIILELRSKKGLSQDELAERIIVSINGLKRPKNALAAVYYIIREAVRKMHSRFA